MKAILLSLLCLSTLASTGTNVKVSDGASAQCKSKADTQRFKFGAYKTELKSVNVANDVAAFKISVNFLSCAMEGESAKFSEIQPYSAFSFQVVSLNKELKEVEVQPELVKMISYRDGVYKKIADIELGNSSKQDVELQIKIEDLLSEEEITSLNEGNEVVGNFDYQVQKEVRINSGKMTDKINFGAFRIHFKAVLDETNTIKIKTLK